MANAQSPKLRSACDACHEAKVKCTGGTPCVHCKNHHQTCHYSFAARIGKPKGSRNRKTLARLQEAALQAAKSQTSSPTPQFSFAPSPFSVSPHSISTVPGWVNAENPLPQSQASYASYAWMPPHPLPTPPGRIDVKPMAISDDAFAMQQQQLETGLHSPQLSRSTSAVNVDFYLQTHTVSSYPAAWQSVVCDCFHWQASNLSSLHALSTFEESLHYITATLAACLRTVGCQSCEKNASMMLFLVASLQMVFDRLDTLLSSELKPISSTSSYSPGTDSIMAQYPPQPEQQNAIRLLQIRHMLFKTQNTLKDVRDAAPIFQRSLSIDSGFSPFTSVTPGASGDPDCLHQVLDKLEAGVDALLGTVGSYVA